MYHDIVLDSEAGKNRYEVPLSQFRKQMAWLSENNYEPITYRQVNLYLNKTLLLKKPIVITFDDAISGALHNAKHVLAEHNFPAVISVVTKTLETEHENKVFVDKKLQKETLTLSELKEFEKAGYEIVSHSHDLHHLGEKDLLTLSKKLSKEEFLKLLRADLLSSRETLLKFFPNQEGDVLVWPFNFYTDDVIKLSRELGYSVLVTTNVHQINLIKQIIKRPKTILHPLKYFLSGFVHKFTNKSFIPRIEISSSVDMNEFVKRVTMPNYLMEQKLMKKLKLA
jgi:peptidoglycan/xylan/chitin deacetylase (PgdA/CDA1 family)